MTMPTIDDDDNNNNVTMLYVGVAPELARIMHVAQFDKRVDDVALYQSHVPIVLRGLCTLYVLIDDSLLLNNSDNVIDNIISTLQHNIESEVWSVCFGRSDGWCVVVRQGDERIGQQLFRIDRECMTLHLVHALDDGASVQTLTQAAAMPACAERDDLGAKSPNLHPHLPTGFDRRRALRLAVCVNRWQEHRLLRQQSSSSSNSLLGKLFGLLKSVVDDSNDDENAALIKLLKQLKLTELVSSSLLC